MRTKAALDEAKARGTKLGGQRDATMQRNVAEQVSALDRAKKVESVSLLLEVGNGIRRRSSAPWRG